MSPPPSPSQLPGQTPSKPSQRSQSWPQDPSDKPRHPNPQQTSSLPTIDIPPDMPQTQTPPSSCRRPHSSSLRQAHSYPAAIASGSNSRDTASSALPRPSHIPLQPPPPPAAQSGSAARSLQPSNTIHCADPDR